MNDESTKRYIDSALQIAHEAGIPTSVVNLPAAVKLLADRLAAAERDRDELQFTFDLRWKAQRRAIDRWRSAGAGRDLTLPDHADLCVWLLAQLEVHRRISTPRDRAWAISGLRRRRRLRRGFSTGAVGEGK